MAFDFDENVELTKDNCRLLLIRLKMEGWIIGNTKVFLKYYNVEYLSRFVHLTPYLFYYGPKNVCNFVSSALNRLYETQVKKIIKVQCMMRAFLAKRNVASKLLRFRQESGNINRSNYKTKDEM